ncbi:hypothetical protein RchiOBHm_Chr6g0257861 [Rosa chinensis]|uniref:Uncharacterized protein n=1 Tax=Rosa chinensis TaxID=74649 RepID=A0A2P6PMG8_ROSCH|nr:hypothetical protein RchiOBHm_Chr6g0257861 [Rosa chinensis]
MMHVVIQYYSDDWPTNVVIYQFVQEFHFFVTRGDDENELILATRLQGFFDWSCNCT